MKKTILLVILDGWGLGHNDESNPIYKARPPAIQEIKRRFPIACLQASGIAVGLPWGEEGNSEVGHLTLGAGKIIYQHFPRISLAIRDGSFFQNQVLRNAFIHAQKNNSAVHLVGLLSSGNVHSSFEHLTALLEMAKRENCPRLFLQLFTDGRDSPPRSAGELLKNLEKVIQEKKQGILTSLAGRFYGLDRSRHWERTEAVYRVLTGEGKIVSDYKKILAETYQRNLNDAFVEPVIVGAPHPIESNDAVIFFEFREDSPRQIVAAFVDQNFQNFPVKKFTNLYFVTMTQYDERFKAPVAFPSETITEPLGRVLSNHNKIQLRLAETEKYAHVTFFFNGYSKEPFPNEYRLLIPSLNVSNYDKFPEMMAKTLTDRLLNSLEENAYDFILINYANPDTVGHTGNYEAALKAIDVVDQQINRLLKIILSQPETTMIITADHGNIEKMIDILTGLPETKHDPSPVPFYLVGKKFEREMIRTESEIQKDENRVIGTLADVAPTILNLLELRPPKEMTGQNLLPFLIVK